MGPTHDAVAGLVLLHLGAPKTHYAAAGLTHLPAFDCLTAQLT
jgi:hypothetical protein